MENAVLWQSFPFIKIQESKMNITPISATIEITRRCNLICKTCFASAINDKNAPEIDINTMKNIIDELYNMGVRSFLLEGGEPTLHTNFISILKHFVLRKIKPGIATNGTHLTSEFCRNLSEIGIHHNVYVSVDGSDATTYQKVRGVNAFKKVIAGINNLKNNKISFAISTVVVNHNVEQIFQLYELCQKVGATFLNLIRFNLEGRGMSNAKELMVKEHRFDEMCKQWISTWGGQIGFFGENCIIPINQRVSILLPNEKDMRKFIAISSDGEVKIGRASGGLPIGNIYENKFVDIWNSDKAKHFLEGITVSEFKDLIEKRRCVQR